VSPPIRPCRHCGHAGHVHSGRFVMRCHAMADPIGPCPCPGYEPKAVDTTQPCDARRATDTED